MKKRVVGAVLFVLVFNAVALLIMLGLPPARGAIWALAILAALLWWHLRGGPARRKRQALIRLRPPRGSSRTVALAVVSTLVILIGLVQWITIWVPIEGLEDDAIFEKLHNYQKSFAGFLAAATMIGIVVPLVEEFGFRGRVQRRLERSLGPLLAITISSILFTLGHVGRPHWSFLLVPLTLGIANGTCAILFRSVWVGVIIHGIWNLALVVLNHGAPHPDAPAAPLTVSFVLSLGFLALGLAGWRQVIVRMGSPLRMRARRRADRGATLSGEPPREAIA